MGAQALTASNALQVAKDAELLQNQTVDGITWHSFTSPVTGLIGPSAPLESALVQAAINIVLHL
ncbi:MAG TPA: hypothetical protein VJX67_08870 [Blastocatellia bacterium]|nr:hypothetical protein [Blastocatellia bacterium]